jgi:hypothetical protein
MIILGSGGSFLYKLLLLLICISSYTFANTKEVNHIKATQEGILGRLDSILSLEVSKWIDELNIVDKMTHNYLNSREKECSGEFASLIINEKGEKIYQKKKLTASEKKHCSYMLVNFRINFNRKIFKIRKDYLVKIQQIQLADLKSLEQKTLTNLERLAQKYK